MTVINPPAWLQNGEYPARTDRLVMSSIVESSGVVSSNDLVVQQSTTPGMTVTITAGRAWIIGNSITYQGAYNFVNDAPVVVSVPAAHAQYSRRDIVVARIQDAAVTGSVDSATLEVITGVASASPVVPATPSNSIRLAVLTVNANATAITTSNIDRATVPIATFFRQPTSNMLIRTSTTRPGAAERFVGMQILETDTRRRFIWDGTQWAYMGGGPAPHARAESTAIVSNWGAGTGNVYWLSKGASNVWDDAYFTFNNGTNSANFDSIQVLQSGNYSIEWWVRTDRSTGAYYVHSYPAFSPGSPAHSMNQAQGSGLPSGWHSTHGMINQYLPAGMRVTITIFANQPVAIRHAGLYVRMMP